MVPPGSRFELEHRDVRRRPRPCLQDAVIRDRFPRAFLSLSGGPRPAPARRVQGDVDSPDRSRHRACREREVVFLHLSPFECDPERAVRLGGAREDDYARGFRVEPVNHPQPFAAFTLEPQSQDARLVHPGRGYNGFTGELGDGNQLPIDVDYQWQTLDLLRSVVQTARLLG